MTEHRPGLLACQTCEERIVWEKGNRTGGKDIAVSRELNGMDTFYYSCS